MTTPHVTGLESYRRRALDPRREVWVYRNLMRADGVWYSLMQRDKVVAHCRSIVLVDARFVVRQGGRRRVLETGQKNVHAFVVGRVPTHACAAPATGRVRYLPKVHPTFVDAAGAPVRAARVVVVGPAGVLTEDPS